MYEPTQEQIDEALAKGDELFDEFLEAFEEIEEEGGDGIGAAYSFWIALTRLLADAGWTEKDLKKDLAYHVKDQQNPHEGTA